MVLRNRVGILGNLLVIESKERFGYTNGGGRRSEYLQVICIPNVAFSNPLPPTVFHPPGPATRVHSTHGSPFLFSSFFRSTSFAPFSPSLFSPGCFHSASPRVESFAHPERCQPRSIAFQAPPASLYDTRKQRRS